MCNAKGFLKRMLPFFATFAVGIFIASFFVSVTGPSFRGGRWKRHEIRQLRIENEELRNENLRLKNEMESLRWNSSHIRHPGHEELNELELLVPPPPPMPVEPRAKR